MSAMKNLREYLTSNGIDTEGFSISATVKLEKAFFKADQDFYEPEVIAIEISNGTISHSIELSSAYDEVARAVHASGLVPFRTTTVPKGTTPVFLAEQLTLPLALTIQRAEAAWELNDAMFDDTPGHEQRFDDARWKVFTLTDEFTRTPCSREAFDALSIEKDTLNVRGSFRSFYAACVNADDTAVVDGEITPRVLALVKETVETFIEIDETGHEMKEVIYGSYAVHPRHRPLFDAVVDDIVASRTLVLNL
jgi:hypothetical protein